MKEWNCEPVEFQYVIPNASFYLVDPLEYGRLHPGNQTFPQVHYGCEVFPPEQIVYTLYEPWRQVNPWVKKEYRVDKLPGNAAAGLINSVQSDYL